MGLCLCADETLNGHDNIVNMINQLDDGTCVPPDLRWEWEHERGTGYRQATEGLAAVIGKSGASENKGMGVVDGMGDKYKGLRCDRN